MVFLPLSSVTWVNTDPGRNATGVARRAACPLFYKTAQQGADRSAPRRSLPVRSRPNRAKIARLSGLDGQVADCLPLDKRFDSRFVPLDVEMIFASGDQAVDAKTAVT